MKDVQLITKELLSDIHQKAVQNTRKRVNYDLRNSSDDSSQRMLNALEVGTHVPIHRHLNTSETVICMDGRLDWVFYEELPNMIEGGPVHDGEKALDETCFKEVARYRICPRVGRYGIQVPQGVWHSVEVFEPSTIMEAKDGPYMEGKMIKNIKKDKNKMNEKKTIHLCLAHMSDAGEEMKFINRAFDERWVAPLGPNVDGFEDDLKRFIAESGDKSLQGKEVVALASGTAAVHLGLVALGVGPGDEVLAQSFTFCASMNPIRYLGATPIIIDSEPDTWNMDPALLEAAIKDRIAKTGKKPKAIVTVYLYGMPAKLDEIMVIARRYDIPVLEDAAEAFGSQYKGQQVGTFGDYGVLSFNGNKMITTSGGGALICPDKEAKERVKWLAMQAREAYPYYQHESVGYNYRMSNVCAGIGRGQMTVAKDHIAHHRHIAKLYEEAFRDVEGITYHKELEGLMASNYWLSTIVLDKNLKVKNEVLAYAKPIETAIGGAAGVVHGGGSIHTDCEPNINVEAMRIALQAENIESRPLWKPMHRQPVYLDTPAYANGVSESIFKCGLCLPSGPMVSDDDVLRIINTIKSNVL
jgi:dTDP-4-amino-4,6-dideoxygalactose transaminase